jgi:hypothetical protein
MGEKGLGYHLQAISMGDSLSVLKLTEVEAMGGSLKYSIPLART